MATLVDLVVRNLLAAGYAPTEDGKATYLLSEKDGKLVRERWTETAPGARKVVAKGVRSGSSAVYLVWASPTHEDEDADEALGSPDPAREEAIFYVETATNSLTAIKLDPSKRTSWLPLDLSSVPDRTVAPSGQLSGLVTPDGALVVFENAAGKFQGVLVSGDGSQVQSMGDFPAEPLPGSPHHVVPGKDKLSLFYVDADKCVRHTALDYSKNVWEDQELNDAHFDDAIWKLTALPVEKDGTFEVFVISGSKVEMITPSGRTELGTIQDGKFVRPSSKECVIMINGNNYGNIRVGRHHHHHHGHGYSYGWWQRRW